MSRTDVDNHKAYLLTHDPRYLPATIEKQAALEHDFQKRLWKHKFANLAGAVGAAPGQLPPPGQMPPPSQMIPPSQRQPVQPQPPTQNGGNPSIIPDTNGSGDESPSLLSEMGEASEDTPTHDLGGAQKAASGPSPLRRGAGPRDGSGLRAQMEEGPDEVITPEILKEIIAKYKAEGGMPQPLRRGAGPRDGSGLRAQLDGEQKTAGDIDPAMRKAMYDNYSKKLGKTDPKNPRYGRLQKLMKQYTPATRKPGAKTGIKPGVKPVTKPRPGAVAPNSQKAAAYVDGYQKIARGGHPANIAFARSLRPGMFPGMDENRGMKFNFSGDYSQAAQKSFEDAFEMNPSTHEYLYGNQKRAEDVKSTQTEDIEDEDDEIGVEIKEQRLTTDPKMAGNEKTASARDWWFDHV